MNQEFFDIDYGKEIDSPQYEPSYVMSADDGVVRIDPLPGKAVGRKYYRRVVPGEKTIYFSETFFS